MKKYSGILMASSAIALTLFSPQAFAQAANTDTAATEIIVTASRRKEKARDVPISVTTISGEKLAVINSSGLDIRFLSARTPSLVAESSFGRAFPRFYIRGLGNTDYDVNAAQPVSVVYDDVALESPMLKSFPAFDLANIEVLRGPQGTLFGRNTPAGVIKIESAKPSEIYGGYGSVSYGTYGTINAEGAVTGAIGGGWNGRLSALVQHRDDWVKNTSTTGYADKKLEGYTDSAIRAQLAYEGGSWDTLINLHARHLDGTPRIFRAGIFKPGTNDFVEGFDVEKAALDGVTSQSLDSIGLSLHYNLTFEGKGTLHSITAFETTEVESSGDIDGGNNYYFLGATPGLNNGAFPSNTGGLSKPKEISQELRFETEQFGKLRGQFGLYYFKQDLSYIEYSYTDTTKTNYVYHDNINENYGLFASGEYKASEALTLRSGLRYSSDRKSDHVSGDPILPAVTLPLTTKVDGSNISGDLSATYVLSPTMNLYARIATGYQGPAIQDRVSFFSVPTTAKSQTTLSSEVGLKTLSFDKKLRFDVDIYSFTTKDIQLTAVGGTSNSARLLNAEKAIGYGIEADLEARPIDALVITAGLGYNYTEIKDPNIGVAPCGSGQCTMRDPINGAGLAVIDGNPLPQAPKVVANFTARYAWPIKTGEVFVFTDWSYRSKVNFFLYDAVEFEGKAYTQGGLRLGYLSEDGLEVAAYVRNISNEIVAESGIDFNNLTGMVSEPRTYGLSIRKRF